MNILQKRKLIIITGITVVFFLLITVIGGFFLLLRDSAIEDTSDQAQTLPNNQRQEPASPGEPTMPPDYSPSPQMVSPDETYQLAITIEYQRNPSFTLTITDITRTEELSTIQHYQPVPGAPFSILKIVSGNDETLFESKFTIPTGIIADGENLQDNNLFPLQESTSRLVISLPKNIKPHKAVITTATGEIVGEKDFILEDLQDDGLRTPGDSSRGILGISTAEAQEGRSFKIVVTNERGAQDNLNAAMSQVRSMVSSIEPWSELQDNIEVVRFTNNLNLNCYNITLGGGEYPACPSSNVMEHISRNIPDWNVIIVVTETDCNCGTVLNSLPPVTTVGKKISRGIIAHELGHATGKMVDEYTYRFGVSSFMLGPNCFPEQNACEAAINDLSDRDDAECSLGCSTVSSWRTATRIMHNTYSPLDHGPFQKCIMGSAIAREIGKTYDCTLTPTQPPNPESPPNERYWGWGR